MTCEHGQADCTSIAVRFLCFLGDASGKHTINPPITNTIAPTCTSELVSTKTLGGRYYLRSNDGKLVNISSCKSLSTLGDRSFYMAAPKLWNDLPLITRNKSSVKGAVSRNSAKLGNYKMPVKLRETQK